MSEPSENATLIFKIATAAEWSAAAGGVFHGSPDDTRDGYIHFSQAHQLAGTLARHFRGRNDLVIAAFDAPDFGPELRWEASRGGELFPHLYGVLVTGKALWVEPLSVDSSGATNLPRGLL